MLSRRFETSTIALGVSLLVNVALLSSSAAKEELSADPPLSCSSARACTCQGLPLGPDTTKTLSMNYPYANASLASVFDSQAWVRDQLVSLRQFSQAKVTMVANTASN